MTGSNRVKLKPGDTIGILGGGQLGRMLAMAAARLGLRCQIFSPDPEFAGLRRGAARDLRRICRCRGAGTVRQRRRRHHLRIRERAGRPPRWCWRRAARCCPTARSWRPRRTASPKRISSRGSASAPPPMPTCRSPRDLREAIARIGLPAVIKTRRFGYDGKGQAIIREGDDPDQVWTELGTKSAILEAFVPFEREISVIAARGADGHVECFDVTENEHRDHILKFSRAPAAIPDALAAEARGIAEQDRHRARLCRRARGRDVRGAGNGAARRCWSTRSRRGCTIPATGRWTAPRSRSSSSTSAPSPAGRSASRSATARSP